MATHVEINHDASTVLTNNYDDVDDVGGTATINGAAALDGTTFGLELDLTTGVFLALRKDTSAPGSNEMRIRIRFKGDQIGLPAGDAGVGDDICKIEFTGTTGSHEILALFIDWRSADRLHYFITKQYGADHDVTGSEVVSDFIDTTEHCFEAKIVRETTTSSADGILEIWVDGVSVHSVSNQQQFNTFANFNRIRVLQQSAAAGNGLTGESHIDEIIIDTDGDADLGCPPVFSGYDLVLGGGQP